MLGSKLQSAARISGTAPPATSQYLIASHATTPFVSAYPWSSTTGFGTKYSNPSTVPQNLGRSVAISPSGDAVAVAVFATTGQASIWVARWSAAGFGTKYSDPTIIPTLTGIRVTFSPSGDAIAIGHSLTPFVSVYPWSSATGFGTKYSDPATLPGGSGNGVAFSPSGNVLAVAHNSAPRISVYPWSSATGFGTKYANAASGITAGNGNGVRFSETGTTLAVGTSDTVAIHIWPWSTASGFGTKYIYNGGANLLPDNFPTGTCNDIRFSPDDTALAVATGSASGFQAWPWSVATGPGTKYTAPTFDASPASIFSCAFSPTGNVIAAAHSITPFLSVFPWSSATGFGTKYTNPATTPPNTCYGVQFTQF